MNQGITTIFVSAEQMPEEKGFSEEDLSVILDAMASTLHDAKRIDRMIGKLGGA